MAVGVVYGMEKRMNEGVAMEWLFGFGFPEKLKEKEKKIGGGGGDGELGAWGCWFGSAVVVMVSSVVVVAG